ncbi:MAG: TetR/AcrR family transcriptional regulator [Sphingobacteriia bacterium]|nr:MAG: TetR/AcrR family transcriptional regulator [Sphingobacteriia bacterium]TAG30768.1 MAG: TetR/AcrR family transcriptional regulator [Sphingobacteriia bacterium]TAH07680.1 MAG: TetR/AcrR family transcriptional regulator [Sphingobacteriia bacterium]
MEQRITIKAQELFFRYGLKSVTMDDIASSLGVSKKTIYQYYTDKDSLVAAVVQQEIDNDLVECSKHSAESENAVHEVFMAIDMMQEMFSTMNPAIIFEMEKYHPIAFEKMNDHKNKFLYKVIKANLEKGMEEGHYREDLDPDIIAKFRIESIFFAFNPELFPPNKYTLLQVEMIIMEHFLYGICTPKGEKLIIKYKKQREKNNQL